MKDRAGRTELHYAALGGDEREARRLIAEGSDVNAADKQGYTPLHFAAQDYRPELVDLLLDAGATVDVQNRHGATALFVAVMNSKGRGEVIRRLLAAGADETVENVAGISPRAGAERIANYDVIQFFPDR